MTHDIHITVNPTRTLTSATPSPVQDNTQNQVIGGRSIAWRTTADGTREQAEHALLRDRRLQPDRHRQHQRARGQGVSLGFFDEGVGERSRTTSTACRTRRNTSSATGFAVEIKYEGALRAANEIETGVPPAVGYENIYTTYMNKSRSYLLDDSKQIQEADGVRSQ